MADNQKLFKIIFWFITGFISLFIISIFTMLYLNVGTMSPDDQKAVAVITVLAIIFLSIPVLIGVFVYKDAKKHHLNQWMWTLVAVYVPYLLGLIIYLVMRNNEKNKLKCLGCGKSIERDYVMCPHCGHSLKQKCPNCDKHVNEEWKVCPYCEAKLK
ncbi:zinc ribbon domain-containing protein [Vallitalea okinawensis]|uniref:zinc ribbon domain-containing protein n=1 Tax=Vallitalea okinawensis TaxID=2078660 RepID=UPI000CFD1D31|nr:zinc ribbon domain-containing protein [Vallitalea okinawensis]